MEACDQESLEGNGKQDLVEESAVASPARSKVSVLLDSSLVLPLGY